MLSQYRKDFPILHKKINEHPLVYLDTAATAQKPKRVIEAMNDFYLNHYGTVHRAIYDLSVDATAKYQHVRKKIQKFLNARQPEEIIFTRGTTESINMVAYSFGKAFIHPGDEILIPEIEHHSNIVPWQILCEDRGAILKVIQVNDQGEIDKEQFASLLSSRTKLIALAHVSNVTGTIHPIREIISMAKKVGAKVLIDGAQAAPHLPVDVQALGCDFYLFSGHKMYGPTGIGILYGKKELLEEMPPYQGGGDMIDQVTFHHTTYNSLPLKFEAGTPMIAEVIGLGTATDYISKIGLENIHTWEETLRIYAKEQLKKIPSIRILGPDSNQAAVLSFVIKDIHPLDLGTLLNLAGFAVRTGHLCAQPAMKRFGIDHAVRISFGLYNTVQEIDLFVETLKKIIQQLS